jgi:hypothetical protein
MILHQIDWTIPNVGKIQSSFALAEIKYPTMLALPERNLTGNFSGNQKYTTTWTDVVIF